MENLANARWLKVIFQRNGDGRRIQSTVRKDILDERGVTLLEVIVATALLGIAVVGLVGALSAVLRVSLTLEEQTASTGLATLCIEEALAGIEELSEPCAAERTEAEEVCAREIPFFSVVTQSGSITPGVEVFRCGEEDPVFVIPTPDTQTSDSAAASQ